MGSDLTPFVGAVHASVRRLFRGGPPSLWPFRPIRSIPTQSSHDPCAGFDGLTPTLSACEFRSSSISPSLCRPILFDLPHLCHGFAGVFTGFTRMLLVGCSPLLHPSASSCPSDSKGLFVGQVCTGAIRAFRIDLLSSPPPYPPSAPKALATPRSASSTPAIHRPGPYRHRYSSHFRLTTLSASTHSGWSFPTDAYTAFVRVHLITAVLAGVAAPLVLDGLRRIRYRNPLGSCISSHTPSHPFSLPWLSTPFRWGCFERKRGGERTMPPPEARRTV